MEEHILALRLLQLALVVLGQLDADRHAVFFAEAELVDAVLEALHTDLETRAATYVDEGDDRHAAGPSELEIHLVAGRVQTAIQHALELEPLDVPRDLDTVIGG